MPQMKPMNWLMFYILFSTYIFFINILNYFTKNNLNKASYKNMKKNNIKSINWKW